MNDEIWWHQRFGDPRNEDTDDLRLFLVLSRGRLLHALPPGAESSLPLIGAALETILERRVSPRSGEGVAPRPGNSFPPFPPTSEGTPRSFLCW